MDEDSLIHALVLQYLSHDGYIETAKAFAAEVHDERQALQLDGKKSVNALNLVKEDVDAVNRQRTYFRSSICDISSCW